MVTFDSCFRILIFAVASSWSKDILWRPLLKNSCVSSRTFNSTWLSVTLSKFILYELEQNKNLYYLICIYTICIFKICINTILSNAICIYTICIYTVCIYICLIRWIHIIMVIMFFTFGIVKVANSYIHLWTCTDAPWVAQKKIVCSSPTLLAARLSNGSSRCQGSWISVSNVAWIHVLTWMQVSLQCKANESVGRLCWTPWWLPLVVPGSLFETCFCKVIIVKALLSNNFVPFGKTNVLETLTYKVEQWWTVFRESKEVLGLKSCLIRRNVSGRPGGHAVCWAYGISKEHKSLIS